MMKFPCLALTLSLLTTTLPLAALAADQDTELQRKQAEVERLKQDLDKAQGDLKKLQKENERLRKEKTPASATAKPTDPPAPPVKPLATLPPLGSDELVDLADLVGHFRATPEAATQRYGKQMIRLRGEVARFDSKSFRRAYDVLLVSPDPALGVVCSFNYAADSNTSAVYTTKRGSELVRSTTRGGVLPLLAIGDKVTIRGRCKGMAEGEIVLTGCELAR